jgi:hypothetical protein
MGFFNNIAQDTNKYILIIQPNFSRADDAKPTDKTEIKTFSGLLCLFGVHRSTNLIVEELRDTDRNSRENFLNPLNAELNPICNFLI